jgi:large subunit ribosomal protein L21
MYAVIETGGKQYRVELGTRLQVELLDVEAGQTITLDRVLLVADGDEAAIGRPIVADAAVEAEVVGRDRGEKLIVYKYRPKARSRVKKGHRQELTTLRITDVKFNGRSAAEQARKAEQDAKTERQRLEEAAQRQAAEDAALAARLAERSKTETKAAEEAPARRGRGKAKAVDTGADTPKPAKGRATRSKATADEADTPEPDASKTTSATQAPETAVAADEAAPEAEADAQADSDATAQATIDAPEEPAPPATSTDTDADASESATDTPRRGRTKKSE